MTLAYLCTLVAKRVKNVCSFKKQCTMFSHLLFQTLLGQTGWAQSVCVSAHIWGFCTHCTTYQIIILKKRTSISLGLLCPPLKGVIEAGLFDYIVHSILHCTHVHNTLLSQTRIEAIHRLTEWPIVQAYRSLETAPSYIHTHLVSCGHNQQHSRDGQCIFKHLGQHLLLFGLYLLLRLGT